jgi:Xaa-Pro aminopeptidase
MERRMREAGAEALSFPVIVAAGANSALPHAIPRDRPVRRGEPILFDWGARLGGYCSDTSRTLILGTPDAAFTEVFSTVKEAQRRAIAAVHPGAGTKSVDAVARDFIENSGYAGRFGHGLGHGTGLAIHEAPRLSPLRDTVLEVGMVVTVEPGVYLPDWGGIRLENQVVVRPEGAEVLNALPVEWNPKAFWSACQDGSRPAASCGRSPRYGTQS